MTRNLIFSLSFTVLLIVSGCYYTQVASPQQSSEEKAWEALIMDSYSGYEPPPAVIRNDRKRPTVTPIAKAEPQDESDAAKPEALSVKEEPAAEVKDAPADKPADAPADKPADAPADKPADAPADKPADVPADKPADAPADKPADAPADKPADKPAAPATGVTPPDPTNSTVYEVKYGDTLGSIAQKTYGSARYSNVIFKANADILKNPNRLKPGMKLILPKL